jgi:hypothetical protein
LSFSFSIISGTILLLISLIYSVNVLAQDKIMTLSGKYLDVNITDDSGANVFFDVQKKNGKTRKISLHKGELFSVQKDGKEESVLYAQDLDFGYDLSEEDIRHLIYGQHDAREGYNANPSMIGGFAVGFGSSLYLGSGLVPLTIPFAYSLAMQIPYIKIKQKTISDQAYTLNDYYKEGYNKTARSKKMIRSFLGCATGVVLGMGISELTQ